MTNYLDFIAGLEVQDSQFLMGRFPHVRHLGHSYRFSIAEDVNVTFTLRVYTVAVGM